MARSSNTRAFLTRAVSWPLKGLVLAIRLYQRSLSPDHGWLKAFFPAGVCRFQPTCSEYAQVALTRYGWRSFPLIVHRVLRCHPGSKGGFDPVPASLPWSARTRADSIDLDVS